MRGGKPGEGRVLQRGKGCEGREAWGLAWRVLRGEKDPEERNGPEGREGFQGAWGRFLVEKDLGARGVLGGGVGS